MRFFSLIFLLSSALMTAQDSSTPPETAAKPPVTMFPHSDSSRFYATGQANIIFQAHPPFHSPYESVNSFVGRGEYKTSLVGTLYLAVQVNKNPRFNTDLIVNFESAGGRGISQALGLAGFTNLDVVRNPSLGSKPYLARISLHQTIGLSSKLVDSQRTAFSLATRVPERRIEMRLGKMSLPDFFDVNAIGSDSHLQFQNWTVDNNGAWDYAADTRGYTYAGVLEYDDHDFSARYVLAAMPTVANGIAYDWAFHRASGQNFELEYRKGLFTSLFKEDRKGVIRVLGFVNHAHMGSYREANIAFLNQADATPDISKHEHFAAVKYGVGLNLEQQVTTNLWGFLRLGWNEGQNESYAYTEVDQTVAIGADYAMAAHGRANDKIGLAFVSNAIKKDHQTYLKLGGQGFLLGDGTLRYGREDILEAYYNTHAWRGLFFALGSQGIFHPGYNTDRGPVWIPTVRAHVEF